MTCDDARDLFSARADDALSPAEQAQLQAHLASCAECQREWARFEQTVALVRTIEPLHAPAGFVDRVMAARPQPWYARLARGLFVPWPVKLPLEAAAIVLVAGLAIMIVQRSPELQHASRLESSRPQPAPATTPPADSTETLGSRPPAVATAPPAATITPPAVTTTPPAEQPGRKRRENVAPSASESPAVADSRTDATAARDLSPPPAPAQVAAEPPRQAMQKAAEAPAKSVPSPQAMMRKEAPPAGEPSSEGKTAAVAPPAAPSSSSELRAMDKGASADTHMSAQGIVPAAAGLQARLGVRDRAAAESAVRDLVTRAGGRILSQVRDSDATVLGLVVATDRWDELRRGLESLGPLRVEGDKLESSGRLWITLRLER